MAADPVSVAAPDPRVGAVVLTRDRADEAARTVARLLALPERPAVVVVDNASADGTAARLRRAFPAARVVRLAAHRGAAARNVGVRRCARPYVALCDDDTWWAPGALARAADLFDAHPALAVVTGTVLIGPGGRIDPTCLEMARSPLRGPAGVPGTALLGFLAGASVVRRAAFLAAGGFEPRLVLGAEEQLLAFDLARRGWALAYVPDLVVHHYPSPRRDVAARDLLLARNRLWIAWLRRPAGRALRETLALLRRGGRDRAARAALRAALGGLPWALRRRRVLPARVERQIRLVEASERSAITPGVAPTGGRLRR